MTSNVGQKFTPPPPSATATCTVFAEALCDIDLMFMSQCLRKSYSYLTARNGDLSLPRSKTQC